MTEFNRRLWIDSAGALWARLINTPSEQFMQWGPHPVYCKDFKLLWRLLERAGLATTPVRWNEWCEQRSFRSREFLLTAELEDVAMYFAALKRGEKFSEGTAGEEFARGRLTEGLQRLIEFSDALPYDAARSPWLEKSNPDQTGDGS